MIEYPEICENQGMFAMILCVIKELKIAGVSDRISEDYIEKAEAAYRSYYDAERKIVRPARSVTDAVGFGEIFPEFLRLWLCGPKTDDMVVNHLDRIPVLLPNKDCPCPEAGGSVRPIFIGLQPDGGWGYVTDNWHPMISSTHAANYANHNMDGIYNNGSSWMRIEIWGYAAGKLHGWNKADHAIANRLWAQIHTSLGLNPRSPRDTTARHESLALPSAYPNRLAS